MASAGKITSKWQVAIPKAVRVRLDLQPGDAVEFVEDVAGVRLQKHTPTSPLKKYRSYLANLAGKDPDALVEAMRGRQ